MTYYTPYVNVSVENLKLLIGRFTFVHLTVQTYNKIDNLHLSPV